MKKTLFLILFIINCSLLIAHDFGILLDQNAGYGGIGAESGFDYAGALVPRFTLLLENGELYASASVTAEYQNEAWIFAPELLRTEVLLSFGNKGLMAGRMQYADPLGLIADGLFDGAQFFFDTDAGIFSAGAWYTGLLYRQRANIAMTGEEIEAYGEALDWDDLSGTYFAPRRLLWALGWEHPALNEFIRAQLSLLGQFDVTEKNGLHSQYLSARAAAPLGAFALELGGALALLQQGGQWEGIALAGELGAAWAPSTPFDSRLSFLGRFSSGRFEDTQMRAFAPLSTGLQGDILKARLPGLSMLSLNYLARLHRTLAAGLSAACFIRSDKGSYTENADANGGYVLGTEFFGQASWSPVSDLQLNLGAGAFLPSLGDAEPDADTIWRLELNMVFSLY